MGSSIFGLDRTKYLYQNRKYKSDSIKSAIEYAAKKHAGQVRKSLDKEPFIIHCLHVGDTLAGAGSNDNTIIAGILHDVIEDTPVKKADINAKFGKTVAGLVNDVTEQTKSRDWMKRCQDYIAHLKKSPKEALCISAADKIDNMASMTNSISRNYNIFKNMVGTPKMQLHKFQGVYEVIKGKIPQKLERSYIKTLIKFIKTLKKYRYL